jgi:peptide chain release factor 2
MQDLIKKLNDLETRVLDAMSKLEIENDRKILQELDSEALQPNFWNDSENAGQVSQRAAALRRHIGSWDELLESIKSNIELAKLDPNGDDSEIVSSLVTTTQLLEASYIDKEFELMLSGIHDKSGAIIEIHAGTGGTDAQDWAQMLQRMYLRYAEQNGFSAELISVSPGEEAGLKSVTFEVNGPYAYGKLKSEQGVHRLVRLSPFNSDNLRQTSFALVEVLPQIEAQSDIEIDPKDLRIDVYRSGGNGGQSVNTTDSAVRITHIPTNIVVAIQNERSQLQNREKAMAILKARLQALMEEQHKAEVSELRGATQSADWGQQIRSYVLHPYTKVKDNRSGVETAQAADVLDGNLQAFIDGYLSSQIGK